MGAAVVDKLVSKHLDVKIMALFRSENIVKQYLKRFPSVRVAVGDHSSWSFIRQCVRDAGIVISMFLNHVLSSIR